ncbi:MAG TPA: phosphatidylserine decarboxylase [Bryobacteraceae bacterium]|jgi:phosphatidylserine decarboxylase|nr:phosphatidylserine decarboxylase [Bryobacteraceae bacterium]
MVITGVYYALGFLASGVLLGYLTRPWAAIPFAVLAAFSLWFFRDPNREIPQGPYAVSPADGKIVAVKDDTGGRRRISIFLSPLDVHVNRAPITGTVRDVQYKPGKFLVASREEATAENEQNLVTVEGDGTTVVFSQIAGLVARRILFWRKPGDKVKMGERIGLIQFGSRCDVFLGPEWNIVVREGQRVSAGSSILAKRD